MELLRSKKASRRAFGLPSMLLKGAERRYLARRNKDSRVSAPSRSRNN